MAIHDSTPPWAGPLVTTPFLYDLQKVARAFGATLQLVRRERGISQEGLQGLCDINRTFVSQLERGIRQPTLTTIMRLAHALNVDPQWFITETLRRLRGEV